MSRRPRVCFVTAVPVTADAFLHPYVDAASDLFEVHVVSSATGSLEAIWHEVPILRQVAPLHDVRAVVSLYRLFRSIAPTLVHSVTPKAGLVAMSAGAMARVPHRVHTFTGQVWATRSGIVRTGLRRIDTFTARRATQPLVDSWAQRSFLVEEGVLAPGTGPALAFGSIAGAPTPEPPPTETDRARIRNDLGIRPDDVLVLYVGRLGIEKGVVELARAFVEAQQRVPSLRLLLIGPDEGALAGNLARILEPAGQAATVQPSFVSAPQTLMVASDIFCMPSHREGFGSAVVEAAACGVPSIATEIYGLEDAIDPEVTGLVVPVSSPVELTDAIVRLALDPERRQTMGRSARSRAQRLFDPDLIRRAAADLYREALTP